MTRSLGVGVCAPYDLARDGGVNSHIRAQAMALSRRGHQVTVFGSSSAPLTNGEVAVGRCVSFVIGGTDTPIGIDPRAWWRIAKLLDARRFDVLHVHEPLMPLVPWLTVRQSTVPVVATFHTHREHGHRWYGRYRWLLDPLMRRVRVRLAVSDAARRTVAGHFPGDYAILPNGIDTSRFAGATERPAVMQPERPHVLYVGRLEPRKGVDRLIRAMTAVQGQEPAARLVIVGDGPDRPQLESLAGDLGTDVTFAGRVSDADLPAHYRAADIVCSPALGGESFGMVLLEAMAARRPVVASRIDGYEELVRDADCVTLVERDDVGALASAIANLLQRPDLRDAMGSRGEAFARHYDWSVVAERLESVYLSAL